MRAASLVLFASVALSVGIRATARAVPADQEKGKAAFEKCAACHSFEESRADGPSLKGVFGRKAGSLEDYRYSAAMTRSGVVWDATTLDAYLADPQGYIRGNRMSFAGMPDKAERDDLIAYLEVAAKPRDVQ